MEGTSEPTERRSTPAGVWREQRREALGAFVDADRLEEAIESGELEPSDATLAVELARMSELEGADRGALVVGLLAAAVARRRGSVRLSLADGRTDRLAERLLDLLPGLFDDADAVRPAAERLREILSDGETPRLVGEVDERRPLVVDDGHLYRHADLVEEQRLAEALAERIDPGWRSGGWPDSAPFSTTVVEEALETVVEGFAPVPTVEQQYAIATAATSDLSVVTGGPGTGKTSLVVGLLRVLTILGIDPEAVALAAPTGKAADRLGSAIDGQLVPAGADVPEAAREVDARIREGRREPATIHRLLGYSPQRRDFRFDARRPLPHDYVVVDEASMIDLELMDRLVAAVDATAKLVLVGDADQLPAVGSGAVFRDLVPETVHTDTARRELVRGGELEARESDEVVATQSVILTENFRMREDDPEGSNVLAVARAVSEDGGRLAFDSAPQLGLEPAPVVAQRDAFGDLVFGGAELLEGRVDDWIDDWYDGPLEEAVYGATEWREPFQFESGRPGERAARRLDDVFEAFESYQLLGVTRRRRRGVATLDGRLRRRHLQTRDIPVPDAGDFGVGEPVMMTKNDYEREIFNGDRGIVLRVVDGESGRSMKRAIFERPGGYGSYALDPLRAHLDPAWSMTVHKSQGSEYDSVGIVLPDEPIPLATRELLYTGITRARRSVTFFGSPALVRDAARRSDERNTGLVERLHSGSRHG